MVSPDVFGTIVMVACNFMIRETYWDMTQDLRSQRQENEVLKSELDLRPSKTNCSVNAVANPPNDSGQAESLLSKPHKEEGSDLIPTYKIELENCINQTKDMEATIENLQQELNEKSAIQDIFTCNCSYTDRLEEDNSVLYKKLDTQYQSLEEVQEQKKLLQSMISKVSEDNIQLNMTLLTVRSVASETAQKVLVQKEELDECHANIALITSREEKLNENYKRMKSDYLDTLSANQKCPFDGDEINGSCVSVHNVPLFWSDARDVCQSMNGTLIQGISINDQTLGAYLFRHWGTITTGKERLWVGATDAMREGTWNWVNGDPVLEKGKTANVSKNARHKDCLTVSKTRRNTIIFQAATCSSKLAFMCALS